MVVTVPFLSSLLDAFEFLINNEISIRIIDISISNSFIGILEGWIFSQLFGSLVEREMKERKSVFYSILVCY